MQVLRPRNPIGFTLVEVLLTIGIITVGMLPLLALLALAVDEQGGANHETIAAIIAQGIFADLQTSATAQGDGGNILYRKSSDYDLGNPASDPNADFALHPIDPAAPAGAIDVLYGLSESGTGAADSTYTPIGELPAAIYAAGTDAAGGTHIVRIHYEEKTLTHQNLAAAVAGDQVFKPQLYEVTVRVEYPAQAAEENRRALVFRAYLRLGARG